MTSLALKTTKIVLNDGNKIPIIGLDTYQLHPTIIGDVINTAIEAGYRHFDCAHYYQNEAEVGRALKAAIDSGTVKREELFVVTKVWPNCYSKGRPTISAQRSNESFGLDYLDLLLIHSPCAVQQQDQHIFPCDDSGQCIIDESIDLLDVWKEFEDIKRSGIVHSIGVSNFNTKQLERIIEHSTTIPATNQVESHPYHNNEKLFQFCRERGITVTAFSPLARAGTADKITTSPLDIPLIRELANKYGVTPAAICIKWQTQRGLIVIPKTASKERLISNGNIFHFDLTDEEMIAINGLDRNLRNCTISQYGLNRHKEWPFAFF